MTAKPLDIIVGQPTTETMNKIVEQMAQMVAPVKTTAWGGRHGSLALVLDDADYSSITKAKIRHPRMAVLNFRVPAAIPVLMLARM